MLPMVSHDLSRRRGVSPPNSPIDWQVGSIFGRTVLVLVCLGLVTASQVLLFLHLEFHRLSFLVAMAPLMALQLLGVVECILLETRSALGGVCWVLLLSSTLTLSLRVAEKTALFRAGMPWWYAMVPLWALEALFLVMAAFILLQGCCLRRYHLTHHHSLCLALYLSCLLLTGLAEVLWIWGRSLDLDLPELESELLALVRYRHLIATGLFCLGVALGLFALVLVARREVDNLVVTYGYSDPLPLSKTARGWEPAGPVVVMWLLLGRIDMQRRSNVARSPASNVSPTTSDGAFGKGLQRRNSGLYEDWEGDYETV
jgi:hypothetical protein